MILTTNLIGCSIPKAQANTSNTPKMITKIVYKDRVVYKDKIVYRDKIPYQNDKITKRILFETSLFLASTIDNTTGLGQQYINSSGPDGTVGYQNETEVVDPNTLLQAITKYNHDNKFDVKDH